jgi:DNA ligase 1
MDHKQNPTDVKLLNNINDMITELNVTKGTNEKVKLLSTKYPHLRSDLALILDERRKSGVTAGGIETFARKDKKIYLDAKYTNLTISDALTEFYEKKITGDTAKALVVHYMKLYPDRADVVLKIFDKDFKIRMGSKLIEMAYPNIFERFEVVLASDTSEKLPKFLQEYPRAFVSRKLDGIRVVTIIKYAEIDGTKTREIKFYSREYREFLTLSKIRDILLTFPDDGKEFVLDGEVTLGGIDNNEKESFTDVVSQIKKKNYTIDKPIYHVFDLIALPTFNGTPDGKTLSDRYAELIGFLEKKPVNYVNLYEYTDGKIKYPSISANGATVQMLPQTVYSEASYKSLYENAEKQEWEGLMIRMDGPYEYISGGNSRSQRLMKVKFRKDIELVVESVTSEMMAFPNATGGQDTELGVVNVIVKYKENKVAVGSGFTADQRRSFANNPNLIVGKLIKIKYQDESKNSKTGQYSLRMPIFICILDA